MNLYKPVEPFFITQKFGENNACVNNDRKVIACNGDNPPEDFWSLYGPRGHKGLDLRTYRGQEVYAAREGVIAKIDTNPRSGLDVRILTKEGDDEYLHIYEHLLGYAVQIGKKVKTGQVIGWADNTGYSSGDHLHLGMEKNGVFVDPLSYLVDIPARKILLLDHKITYLAEKTAILAERVADYIRQKTLKGR